MTAPTLEAPTAMNDASTDPTNVFSLFSGIGGLELGLERAGMTVVGQVENNPFCLRVLAKHWPEVPRHEDVRTAPAWWSAQPRPRVHVVAGGFPCQPSSEAGLRLGEQDERWLWPAMRDVIDSVRPAWVIAENVPGLLQRGIGSVVSDLRALGYRYRVGTIPACALGAAHARERVFVLAHTDGAGCGPRGGVGRAGAPAFGEARWPAEPGVGRVAYGVPDGVDRRRALGNAVVPQVGEWIGRLVMPHVRAGVGR